MNNNEEYGTSKIRIFLIQSKADCKEVNDFCANLEKYNTEYDFDYEETNVGIVVTIEYDF